MNALSCPAYVRIKNYESYSDNIYHKDSLNNAILDVVQSIDEKNFPFDKDILSIILYLVMIGFPGFMLCFEIYSYINNVPHNNGKPVQLDEVIMVSIFYSIFIIGGIYYIYLWIQKLRATLTIRSGSYDIMILSVTDKDIKVSEHKDDNGRVTSTSFTYFLIYDKLRIECKQYMYTKSRIGDKSALLVSHKHVIGLVCF